MALNFLNNGSFTGTLTTTGVISALDGNSTQWNSAYAKTNAFTTIGTNFTKIPDVSAVSYTRINANQTISLLSASAFRTAIGAGTSSTTGTVTKSGTPVNNQLAVWTTATNIEGEPELTYSGSTFTVGGQLGSSPIITLLGTSPKLLISNSKNGNWTPGESLGLLEWFGADTSGGGAKVQSSIDVVAQDSFGAHFNMLFKLSSGSGGNTELMRIRGIGLVGIGTTNPQTKLQLGGSGSDTNLGLSITNPDGAGIHFRKKSGFNNALEIVNSNNDINIITGTTSCIYVESTNGNVGIRNTAPSSKLEIGDNVNANNVFRIDGVHSRVLLSGNVDAPTDGTGMWNFINHAGTNATTRFYVQDANNVDSRLTFRFTGNGGSTEILSGSSTGNVGIGTVSPGRKLEVAGDVGINGYIHHNGDNSRIGFEGNDVIRMYTANTVRLQVNTNGNVGIGTTTVADNRLKVIGGSDYQTLNIGESQLANTIKRSGLTATHYNIAEQDIAMMSVFSSSTSTAISIGGSAGTLNAAMDIRFYTASNTTTTTGTQRMVIRSSGRVGIGTNEPITQLTLGTGSTGISFQSGSTTLNSGKIAVIKPVEVGNGNGELVFETYKGGSGGGERMRIDNDGNVGIGITNPIGKLDVFRTATSFAANRAGTLSTAGLIVKSSGAFDSKISFSSGASSVQYIQATNNSATVGRDININPYGGNVITAGTMQATNFILSSDKRLKENIKTLEPKKIDIKWKSFNLKTDDDYRTGVIAQELEKTNPEFVREDSKGFKSVAYIDLLIAKIAELEARLEKAGI